MARVVCTTLLLLLRGEAMLLVQALNISNVTANQHRSLSFERIAGYLPSTQVTGPNAIDMDLATMTEQIAIGTTESFQIAQQVYEQGGHSKTIARIFLAMPLPQNLAKGTPIVGSSNNNNQVLGNALDELSAGSTEITFQYRTSDIQASQLECQVGALPEPKLDGCLTATGTLLIDAVGILDYAYDPTTDNFNARTIQGFSTTARRAFFECGGACPYQEYALFVNYYGNFDYANEWIQAAFAGTGTALDNGNADFSNYTLTGRGEAIEIACAYMSVWLFAIGQMEDALDDCEQNCLLCNDDPFHSWDVAVAYYAGSLEGQDGSGNGVFTYALADKRCLNFKTCGDGTSVTGTAKVNFDIITQFAIGQERLLAGNCADARENKERIVQLMTVPLIQSTLRYAYITDATLGSPNEKAEAEGAAFAASVLPMVHACNAVDAEIIFSNMRVGSGPTDFTAVKEAFENNYECMGITCADVGGIFDASSGAFFAEAEPCTDDDTETLPPTTVPPTTTPPIPTVSPTLQPSPSPTTSAEPSTSPTALAANCARCACDLCSQVGGEVPGGSSNVITYPNFGNGESATCGLWVIVACSTFDNDAVCEELQTGAVANECCSGGSMFRSPSDASAPSDAPSSAGRITKSLVLPSVPFLLRLLTLVIP